jgi:hypothetical protein
MTVSTHQLPLLPPPLKLPPPPEKLLELEPDDPEDHPDPEDQPPPPDRPGPIFFIIFLPQGVAPMINFRIGNAIT